MTPIRGGGAANARVFQLFYEETFLPSLDSPQIPLKGITPLLRKHTFSEQLVEGKSTFCSGNWKKMLTTS